MVSKQEEQDSVDFQQYWLILKRRWLLIAVVTGSVFGLSALPAFRQKPIYEAEGKLLFHKTDRVSSLTNPSASVGELSGVTLLSSPLDTEAEIIRSNPIIKKTITSLSLTDKKGTPLEIDEFLKKLKVKSVKGTDILAISYSSSDPKEAAAVVNSVMKYYLANNISVNQAQARAANRFLSNQLPLVEARVVRAEAGLRKFKEQNKVVALDQEAATSVGRVNELSGQITQAQSNLVDAETRSQLLQRQLKLNSQQAVDKGNLSQLKGVQELLAEYQKTQNELAVARSRFTNEHPAIANLTAKAAALKKELATQVSENGGSEKSVPTQDLQMGELKQTLTAQLVQSDVERSALANRLKILQDAYTISQKRLGVLPKLQEKQQQLERQLQVARGTYEELLKRSQEVEVVVNQNVGNARVLSPATVPGKPPSKITMHLALGGFLGIFLGMGIALILEAMDRSLKTTEQAQQLFGYPLLGTIPHLGQKFKGSEAESLVEMQVRDNPYSTANSAFEILQTNLDFTVFDKPLTVIAVVSSIPGEGRSFVASNLAVAKSHMGRRVLLVDANMRHSCQEQIWKLPNLVGLSNVLVGQAEFSRTTQQVMVNLDVLTVGTIPPNPAALLGSQRMSLLIQEAIENYDCVIIDTPPISLFGDALILSKMTDGILLVVRPAALDSAVAKSVKTMLEQARSRVLGMVVNGVTAEKGSGYYHSRGSDGGKRSALSQINLPGIRG